MICISRSLTDYCYACYLSNLAVRKEFQKEGVGRKSIEMTKKEIGGETALILLSAPLATEYYPKIGFEECKTIFQLFY
ncbi:GNAT family N-acetyltransferase [Flavimarina sp. Hel_I_48]|uniref:GNAT family N-acetyltransferase n=1 Tax=Flavimarina sp. Hel_I_48 TaxID=1392488 RepID=UPI0019D2FF9A|nr:GNAT family N-acetyltransferase [Flavimarina sp. Hel_I_48]